MFWGLFCHFLAIISRSLTGLRFISLVLFMNFCLKLSWVSLFSTLFNLSFCIYTDLSCYSSSLCYKFVVSLWNDYIRIRITKKNKTFRILLFFFVTVAEMCFFAIFILEVFFFNFVSILIPLLWVFLHLGPKLPFLLILFLELREKRERRVARLRWRRE